ncbi:MAG: hypothetical protein A2Y17_07815 [Clostridiales bacterium GWF2_38_85]|nr:MAG: hypothetical protein A2Y17_07815 [Clostridiales bacterium GWF2_38_85]HBL84218.1 hypothetical protein [Clostridiales bacterium]
MANDCYSVISEKFSLKRENAERVADARRYLLHEKFPEIKEIDFELASTGIRIMDAALSNNEELDKLIEELKIRNLELQKKRNEILAKNGFSLDYSDIRYECNKCNDSGYVGLNMCECFKRELNRENYMSAGLGKAFEDKTFENFNINFASGKSENGTTPRENLENCVKYCKEYSRKVCKTTENLMIAGGTGLGKTHLSSAIAKAAIEGGCNVLYYAMVNILDKFQRYDTHAIDQIMECELLICDDFGSEYLNEFRISVIYNLLNTRLINGRSLLLNTNLSSDEIRKRYDDRICSRLFGEFKILRLYGNDVRRLKKDSEQK